MSDSISIPPERLVPIATETSSSGKTIGSIFCFILGIVVIAGITMLTNPDSFDGNHDDAASTLLGVGFWILIFGAFAAKFIGNARRAGAAAAAAQSQNVAYTFHLTGRMIVAADANGAPLPSRTFRISRKSRAMLLAVPRAAVVDKS